ncbi:ecdysteroid-phosphate phosphatase-like isoform X2 [Zophobas morio]|uniref:ecdysteroid-phosphate phosphatase-like isoform X2 n=1 Tax=Zophobas morio TaxID=2755281 RepID=UPI003083C110
MNCEFTNNKSSLHHVLASVEELATLGKLWRSQSDQEPRKLYIMRHGERVDLAFSDWMSQSFDKNGNYCQSDLNMPDNLPKRSQGYSAYAEDTPLTKIGIFQAQLTGEAFKKAQLDVSHVYSSPSLRCIQTCDAFLKSWGKNNEIKIKVEPGLYEWWALFGERLPDWLTPEDLAVWGYNVDLEYKPIISVEELGSKKESATEYYSRSFRVSTEALKAHGNDNVLFVAHAATLEVCTWKLTGEKPRIPDDTTRDVLAIPYCGFIEVRQIGDKWEKNGRPFLQLSHTANATFDYNRLS